MLYAIRLQLGIPTKHLLHKRLRLTIKNSSAYNHVLYGIKKRVKLTDFTKQSDVNTEQVPNLFDDPKWMMNSVCTVKSHKRNLFTSNLSKTFLLNNLKTTNHTCMFYDSQIFCKQITNSGRMAYVGFSTVTRNDSVILICLSLVLLSVPANKVRIAYRFFLLDEKSNSSSVAFKTKILSPGLTILYLCQSSLLNAFKSI